MVVSHHFPRTALTALLALILPGCAPLRSGSSSPIRVLVWNIHAGKDASGVDNLQRLAALIGSQRPDVVLLQEVDRGTRRSGGVDQVAELERLTGMHGTFGKSLDYEGGTYGIAILSRDIPRSSRTVDLPVTPPQARAGGSTEPRVALSVEAPFRDLDFAFNTHLDAGREPAYRAQETEHIIGLALPKIRYRLILGGDFNSTPDSAVHEWLVAAGLRDAWGVCGEGQGWTYPASEPSKRIDYLYLSPQLRCRDATVLDSTASDHRPLMVTLGR